MKLQEFLHTIKRTEEEIIELKGEEALEAVKRSGDALQYVKEQSETICLEAVKRNGYALRYVKEQSETICLEAVKRNGYALQYVSKKVFTETVEQTSIEK